MSNTQRNQLIHALLAIQPLLTNQSVRYSLAELREITDTGLLALAADFTIMYSKYIVDKAIAGETMAKYSKLKQLIKRLSYLSS